MHDVALVVMARAPEFGRVKTRLAASIGSGAAMDVYRQLLTITHHVAEQWHGPVLLESDGDAVAFEGTGFECLPCNQQPSGRLGRKIAAALHRGLDAADRCIVIGTDCPALSRFDLVAVSHLLRTAPVAFGPAEDGGFWAIGTSSRLVGDVVEVASVTWSTADTLAMLRAALTQQGFESRVGPTRADCDDGQDLERAIAAGLLTLPANQDKHD